MNIHGTTPTEEQYAAIMVAYRHFNLTLFSNKLPDVLFVFQRGRAYKGYFWAGIWNDSRTERSTDELALNPDLLADRPMIETLSTLVHEMCHVEQEHYGENKPKSAYHNKEWAAMMKAVGLIPSTTGEPGGKETGQKVTHYIEPAGAFETVAEELLASGWVMPWIAKNTRTEKEVKRKSAKKASNVAHKCPSCGASARAKTDANIVCGDCMVKMEGPEE